MSFKKFTYEGNVNVTYRRRSVKTKRLFFFIQKLATVI